MTQGEGERDAGHDEKCGQELAVVVTTFCAHERIGHTGENISQLRIFASPIPTEMQYPNRSTVPNSLRPSVRPGKLYVLHMKLYVVYRVQFDAALKSSQCQVKHKLISPQDVSMLIYPAGSFRYSPDSTIEG